MIKSLIIDNDYDKKNYNSFDKKKVLLIITDILIGSASTKSTSTLAKLNPSVGVIISSSTALLTSTAILITNEYISKSKIRYTKIRDWVYVVTLPCEKTL